MNRRSSGSNWTPRILFTLVGVVVLACSFPGVGPTAEVILEPTVRPTQPEQPAGIPTATAVPPTAPSPGSQVVLHQPFAIIVAYVGPETGVTSALFTPLQQAGQKAIEDHGLVNGFGVNLVPFNDDCGEARGLAAAQQVVADERIVAVLGPVCSASVRGVLPLLEDHNVVMVSGSATAAGLSVYGPSVFHRTLLDDDQVAALGYPSQIYIQDLPAVQAWLSDFAAWGGMLLEEGLNHYSPYQYDAMRILLRALDESSQILPDGSLVIDREALRAAVRGTANYAGVTGSITFESDGDRMP